MRIWQGVCLSDTKELSREPQCGSVHQLGSGTTQVFFEARTDTEENEGQGVNPLCSRFRAKSGFELSVKAFYETICSWVVGCGPYACGTEKTHELMPKVRFKLGTTIGGDGGWCAETGNPTGDEGMGYGSCCDVGERNGLRPSSETVDTRKKVGVAPTWRQGSNEIYVYMIKPCIRCRKGTTRGNRMLMHFGSLTLEARTSPPTNVCLDSRPHISSGDQSLSGTGSRMRQGVQSGEH